MKRFAAVLVLVLTVSMAVSPTAYAADEYWSSWGTEVKNAGSSISEAYNGSPGLFIMATPVLLPAAVFTVAVLTPPLLVTSMFWSGRWVFRAISGDAK